MSSEVIATSVFDTILSLQLTVAWAGEARCEPRRLGWWQTDLVDLGAGGDFLKRLLPRTHAWASLEAVREVARRTDESCRRKLAQPDDVRTLFFFGFELDERLADRLAELKRAGEAPAAVLPFAVRLDGNFSQEAVSDALASSGRPPAFEVVPGGRQLKGPMPASPELAARNLVAALLPFAPQYPMPFYRVKA